MNQNNIHPTNGTEGVKAAVKKPAGEDLSRWENEGGNPAPTPAHDPEKDFFQKTLDRLFQGGQANIEQLRMRLETQVRERPLAAIGIATAFGFLLAGGFRSRSGRKILKHAIQFGMDQYGPVR